MATILLTAFEPYESWEENASWLTLMELTRDLPTQPRVTTRRYPVDFAEVKRRLTEDLAADYDVAIHLGQAPGSSSIHLERIGINVGRDRGSSPIQEWPLSDDGPMAYSSELPLDRWCDRIRSAGIPARVSYHAGTYLCNATLYWSHYFAEKMHRKTRATFLHLPLDCSQTLQDDRETPSLPARMIANAIRIILDDLAADTVA